MERAARTRCAEYDVAPPLVAKTIGAIVIFEVL